MPRVSLNPDEWLNFPHLARDTNRRMTEEGILVAALDARGRLNPMTIGWGVFGCIWGRPMFLVLVRPSRYTFACIEHTGDYTVNVLPPALRQVADYCGTRSGRDVDKMTEQKLSPMPSTYIHSPGLAEANLIFECSVVHRNDVHEPAFTAEIISNYYPQGDFHRVYFGHILAVSVDQAYLKQGH